MTVFVALLRAVNVGGRSVKMADLKALFAELGFEDARTYLQSGNVVFDPGKADRAAVARKIEKGIEARYGFKSEAILRTGGELKKLIAKNPFPAMAKSDPSHLTVVFLANAGDGRGQGGFEAGVGRAGAMEAGRRGPLHHLSGGHRAVETQTEGEDAGHHAQLEGHQRAGGDGIGLSVGEFTRGGASAKIAAATASRFMEEDAMSKGRDRPGKEKKKPKSDKNKKDKHQPFGGKTPPTVTVGAQSQGKK